MSFNPRQMRAISSYCVNHNAAPQLCTYPTVFLTDKATRETLRFPIKEIEDIYDEDKKQAAKERARARRAEQKSQGQA